VKPILHGLRMITEHKWCPDLLSAMEKNGSRKCEASAKVAEPNRL